MYQVGDKVTFGWVVFTSAGLNMSSDWEDYIFVNKLKNGTYSLKAYKLSETATSASRKVWINIDSVLKIRTAHGFLAAVRRLESSLSVDIDIDTLIEVMRTINANFASEVEAANT